MERNSLKNTAVVVLALAFFPAAARAQLDAELGAPMIDTQRLWDAVEQGSDDEWESEKIHGAVSRQLDVLVRALESPARVDTLDLATVAEPGFESGALVPAERQTVFRNGTFWVERWVEQAANAEDEGGAPAQAAGSGGLADALRGLVADYDPAGAIRVDFKVVEISREGGQVETRLLVDMFGASGDGLLERHAVWEAAWTEPATDEPYRLRRIRLVDFEQTRLRGSAQTLFSDSTDSVLSSAPSYREQLLRGFAHWARRISDWPNYPLLATPGIAVGDVDGDGLDDLYLGQQAGLPNRLFVQQADGTVRDVSRASGADWLEDTRGVLLVDLDNDGDQDLVAAIPGSVLVAANDGNGAFSLQTALAASEDTTSLAAADYDADGDLDVYVCADYRDRPVVGAPAVAHPAAAGSFVYHDANDGGANVLFRNDGAWKFTDVTAEAGLDVNNSRYSFAAAWEDYDNDGDQDLYVANDYGRNNLYRNDGGRFSDVAGRVGAEDSASGMSVTWADYDHDGRMDVYVSNMFSAAGSRITAQPQFKAASSDAVRSRYRRFARGNTLLANAGGDGFADASVAAGVTMGRWAWSSNFVDLDNDGLEDIVVANGYITGDDTGDL